MDADVGTPLVQGAQQTGDRLLTDGWKPGLLVQKGLLCMIRGVHQRDPKTGVIRGSDFMVVVLADTQANDQGVATLHIWPPLLPGDTVDQSPCNNAMIALIPDIIPGVDDRRLQAWCDEFICAFDAEMRRLFAEDYGGYA